MENNPTTYKKSTTKKCPMCAEEIKTEAKVCHFCGAHFWVTKVGYCTSCHAKREANEMGSCCICENPLTDVHMESELVQTTVAKPAQPAPPGPVRPQGRKARISVAAILGILFVSAGAIVIALIIYMPSVLPLPEQSTRTPSPTLMLTSTITPRPTLTPTLMPVEVTFDNIGQYPRERLVILVGKIVNLKSTKCDETSCGLLLSNPAKSSQTIPIFVNIPYSENTPAPSEMKPLHDNFSMYDIRLRTMDGEYAFVGQIIRVTGRVWETTGGEVCISDIFEIELAR